MPPKVVEFEGQEYEFPADATDAEIDTFLNSQPAMRMGGDPMRPDASHGAPTQPPRSSVTDFGIGLLKSPLSTISAGGNLLRKIPVIRDIDNAVGQIPLGDMVPEAQGAAQWYGKRTADLLTALPAKAMTAGSRLLPIVANAIERRAVPGLTKAGATQVLDAGRGIVSQSNAKALQATAKATPTESATQIFRGGKWVPKSKGPSPMQAPADAMTSAANAPTKWPSAAEFAGIGLGGIYSPAVSALIAGRNILARPLPGSIMAQGLHKGAPAIQGAAGVGMSATAQAMLRLFGQPEPSH